MIRLSIRHLPLVITLFVLFSFTTFYVDDPIEKVVDNLDVYVGHASPCKLYVQTDRYRYAVEDTVWFKVYALDAASHSTSTSGEVIYVDVVDTSGETFISKKLYTEGIGVASDFVIRRGWLPGRYKVRAYTKFMLNQDQAYIYNKEIHVVDINKAYDDIAMASDSIYAEDAIMSDPWLDVKFFPESGDLVAGIKCRVAIKVENYATALGSLTGVIEDASGQQVIPFKIYERGYGLASFIPQAGEKYIARLDLNKQEYDLPEVKEQGYNITALNKPDEVSLIISSSTDSGLSQGDILIHSRGRVLYHDKLSDIESDSHVLQFDTREMPSGVVHVAFFDKDGIPRAERLFFVDNVVSQSVITSDKVSYNKREEVSLSLAVTNGGVTSYDCAVSVCHKSNLAGASPSDNIKSWMLLNSDLRGEIKNPTFYFAEPRDSKRAFLLDLVMMTHGWRRFAWEDMRNDLFLRELEYERELGLYVTGYTCRLISDRIPIKSKVVLNFFGDEVRQEEVVTADDGRFVFGPYVIEDSLAVIVQARRYKDGSDKDFLDGSKRLHINIDTPQVLNLDKPIFEENRQFDFSAYKDFVEMNKYAQSLKDRYHDMEVLLSEVVLTARRKTKEEEMDEIVKEKSNYLRSDHRIVVDDNAKLTNRSVFDLLRDIPGVRVQGLAGNESVWIRGNRRGVLYIVDGFPVDQDLVRFININEVLFVDVLKGPAAAIFGSRGGAGVIAIYTGTDPDSQIKEEAAGIVNFMIGGFDKYREFYSPDYSKDVSSVYEADMRTTLYWNPSVLLSSDEERSISFFTGDNAGDYLVTTEGLGADGEPIFANYQFSVVDD